MPNKTVQLSSGSSRPLTLTPITVAHRESDVSKERTLIAHTKQTKEIMSVISGSSPEAMTKQTSHIVESFDTDSREAIVANLDQVIKISAEQMSSMKSCLSLPWNLVREIRRWLDSFKIEVPSVSSMRSVVGDWVGPSLRTEEIPATVVKNKTKLIALKPWCYIYNIVGYVLKYLDELDENGLLYDGHIAESEIHLKVGGDHGGGSFKMSFQIANVENPNKPENSVVFSVMEAKDYKSNLRLCLERFRRQVEKFSQVTWKGRKIVVFLFGDYEFLCAMYGLSGDAGKFPCLWCTYSTDEIQHPEPQRGNASEYRSLDTLNRDLGKFREEFESELKKEKKANNVIDVPFFQFLFVKFVFLDFTLLWEYT